MCDSMNDSIDAVILWVDGNDPKHLLKRRLYQDINVPKTSPFGKLDGRFIDAGEIKYCIYSIKKFSPWIRKIFIITDEQYPEWLNDNLRKALNIEIVDHKVLFRDHLNWLPTFNTLSILTLQYKIPGLAEKYVMFDDDCFLINPVIPEDFFVMQKTVFRGKWVSIKVPWPRRIIRIGKHILFNRTFKRIPWRVENGFTIGARMAGFTERYFETAHAPHASRKRIEQLYYEKFPEALNNNVIYRFRNDKQFGPTAVFSHLIIKEGNAVLKDASDALMIIPRSGGLKNQREKFETIKNSRSIKFLCIQDMWYLKQENLAEFSEIEEFLTGRILFDNEFYVADN